MTIIRKAVENDAKEIARLLVRVGEVHWRARPDMYTPNMVKHDEEGVKALLHGGEYTFSNVKHFFKLFLIFFEIFYNLLIFKRFFGVFTLFIQIKPSKNNILLSYFFTNITFYVDFTI